MSSASVNSDLEAYNTASPQITPSPVVPETSEAKVSEDYATNASSPNWFSRFASKFSKTEELLPQTETVTENSDDDFRELAQISLSSFKRMSSQELNDFKNTEEFSRFKELLRKHNIIK